MDRGQAQVHAAYKANDQTLPCVSEYSTCVSADARNCTGGRGCGWLYIKHAGAGRLVPMWMAAFAS